MANEIMAQDFGNSQPRLKSATAKTPSPLRGEEGWGEGWLHRKNPTPGLLDRRPTFG
jgi:hypothetical protein